jgi:hypothetical protein
VEKNNWWTRKPYNGLSPHYYMDIMSELQQGIVKCLAGDYLNRMLPGTEAAQFYLSAFQCHFDEKLPMTLFMPSSNELSFYAQRRPVKGGILCYRDFRDAWTECGGNLVNSARFLEKLVEHGYATSEQCTVNSVQLPGDVERAWKMFAVPHDAADALIKACTTRYRAADAIVELAESIATAAAAAGMGIVRKTQAAANA